jgi:hypothetical protein
MNMIGLGVLGSVRKALVIWGEHPPTGNPKYEAIFHDA